MKDIEKKDTPTPEEHSLPAATDKRQKLLRVFFRELTKTSLYALAAIGVLILVSIAWFVSNNRVDSGTSTVQADNGSIILATTGYRQTTEKTFLRLDPDPGKTVTINDTEYYYTDGGTIALHLAGPNELVGANHFVFPGASGEVTFYVIPKQQATVTLYLGLAGYEAIKDKDTQEITDVRVNEDTALNALLSGHILLFRSYDARSNRYSDWLRPQNAAPDTLEYTIHIEDAEVDVPYEVTFYWVWPLRYENMLIDLLDQSDAGATGNFLAFIDEQATQTKDTDNEKYLYSRIFLTPQNQPDLTTMDARTKAYDLGDEYIGANAEYLYLTIQTNSTFDFPESKVGKEQP